MSEELLKAHVENGRYVVDATTNLPDGQVLSLKVVRDDNMSAAERARLHGAIRDGFEEIEAGGGTDMVEFLDELELKSEVKLTEKAKRHASNERKRKDSPLSLKPQDETLELLLEAARRANWDAQFGPPHLRSGRFFIWPTDGRAPIPPEQPGMKPAPNGKDKDSRD